MPLKPVMNDKLTNANDLLRSSIMSKAVKTLGRVTFDSMTKKLLDFIEERSAKDNTYHIFAIAFGDTGQLPHGHYDYLWSKAIEVYGDTNEAKRFLGTFQMYCFCLTSQNWLFIQDPEKKQKLEKGEIPDVTEYFVDVTGNGYKNITKNYTLEELRSKFNNKRGKL